MTYTLSPGPVLAGATWHEADANGDAVVDETEAAAWLAESFAGWQSTLGGESLAWETTAVSWPSDLTAFELGDAVISAERVALFPANTVTQADFLFHNPYAEAISLNWFYVSGADGASFQRPLQENGRLTAPLAFAPETAPFTYWDSGTPTLAASGTAAGTPSDGMEREGTAVSPTPAPPSDSRPYARLTDLVRQQERSPVFLITAFSIALALGAMHGLTPGHGKALVAAYFVGSRGTPKHAVALGGLVTFTHTGSILLIGLITLAASRYFIPTDLIPILEVASGLLIIGLGFSLLQQRWRGWRGVQLKRARETSGGSWQGAGDQSQITNLESPAPGKQRIAIGADIPVRVYDEALPTVDGVIRVLSAGGRWRRWA